MLSVSILPPKLASLLFVNRLSGDDPLYVTRFKTAVVADLELEFDTCGQHVYQSATVLNPLHKKPK